MDRLMILGRVASSFPLGCARRAVVEPGRRQAAIKPKNEGRLFYDRLPH